MLSFLTALAFIEVGAGVVVAEAWKLHRDRASLSVDEVWSLHQLLERLRVLEMVVAGGAAATTILWSFLAVSNASHVARNSRRLAVITVVAWGAAPLVLIGLGAFDSSNRTAQVAVLVLMAQAIAMYAPFGLIARASSRVGGASLPFLRWYLAVTLAFAVHHVFTGSLDLAAPSPSDDLGRTAMLYLVNGVIVGVIVVMAAEATRSMQVATSERLAQHRMLHADAHQRTRSHVTSEQETMPMPPAPIVTPIAGTPLPAPVAPSGSTGSGSTGSATLPFAAPTLLETPPSLPVTRES